MRWLLQGITRGVGKVLRKGKTMLLLFLAAVFLVFLSTRVFRIIHIEGDSMFPSLKDGDYVLVNRLLEPKNGDVAVFESKAYQKERIIKRIAASGGDVLAIKGGKLWRNGAEVEEKYRNQAFAEEWEYIKVPDESFFVLGDNTRHSFDSRKVGYMSKEELYGTVIFHLDGIR